MGIQTNVWVNAKEMEELATAKSMDLQSFVRMFTEEREIKTPEGRSLATSLKNKDGACTLYCRNTKSCTVHDAKPSQCRSYPFGWPNAVVGQAEWGAEAQRCPGIDSEKAEVVTKETIVKNLLVGLVHDRGMGENWTHDEAIALLTEADAMEGGKMLRDFEEEFFSSHASAAVYESQRVRVVDSTTPASDESGSVETFRRLEFVGSATVSQSEVVLDPWGHPDHSRLALDVHKLLASIVRARVSSVPGPKHMVLIGGGAGCLSSHLASDVSLAPSLRVDVVEPDAEVSEVATEYFGAKYNVPEGSTYLHETTGEDFLGSQRAAGGAVDALVIDAVDSLPLSFFTGKKSDDLREPIAPPPSLLQDPATLIECLKPDGVTIINCLGNEGLLDAMHSIITSGLQAEGIDPVFLSLSHIPNRIMLLTRTSGDMRRLVRAVQAEDEHVQAYRLDRDGEPGTVAREVPFEA